MKVVVLQSNYLPWKGYFDLIRHADLFIFYDDVQYTKNDWRNRNKIKTSSGTEWITIPCGTDLKRLIREVTISDHGWQSSHWNRIQNAYKDSEFLSMYKSFFEDFYIHKTWTNLSSLNQYLIRHIAQDFLGLTTRFADSTSWNLRGARLERLIDLLQQAGATEYISGPSAKAYIDPAAMERAGISLTWMDYSQYRPYRQLFPPFVHEVSIIDLLFNEGPRAIDYISGTKAAS